MAIDRYAVVGTPIAHSLSPRIHAAFAEQCGQALSYEAIEIPRDDFVARLRDIQRDGFAGINVTVPFKQQAWRLCDSASELADAAGAANVLSFAADGRIRGDNTDGTGLVRDLEHNLGLDLAGRDILLLGAGGAVRGVLPPLLARAPARVSIANRTQSRAESLAQAFADRGRIEALPYGALGERRYDLIINGTSAGLDGETPPLPPAALAGDCLCYDMVYSLAADTPFVAWAKRQGASAAHDGLGMLVEQAAEAFRIWRGMRPRTDEVIRLLRG